MSRISLKETYDNRSVIAQIAKVTDTAEDAAETVEQKAAEINDALTDVNAAVQAAEGAVTTANAASAAAQQSAQTVAGYENRLGAVESGLDAVTLRVTTAEGQIVTIQGRVTALETADGQNVKITGTHAIGNYAVLLTGNQDIAGIKNHLNNIRIGAINGRLTIIDTRNFPDLTNANIIGGKNIGCGDGQGGTKTISEEFVRLSGFGVTGGVEHMFTTSCVIDGTDKSVILRIRLNPATGKAQLMFGSNVISEVDL